MNRLGSKDGGDLLLASWLLESVVPAGISLRSFLAHVSRTIRPSWLVPGLLGCSLDGRSE